MRIYSEDSEEALRARTFLKQWTADGLLTDAQQERLQQETVSDLRTTNLFLRLVLFLFTLFGIAATAALFAVLFLTHASHQTSGIFGLIFAAALYAAAEIAVAEQNLYRYGIEEALLAGSVGFLFFGLLALFDSSFAMPHPVASLIPATCTLYALWIWHRFGLWYAFPAAMIFVALVPDYWTVSTTARHVFLAILYLAGLFVVAPMHKHRRFDVLGHDLSLAEGFLWLGLYLATNLQASLSTLMPYYGSPDRTITTTEWMRTIYWITWVLIWCLPVVTLIRGIDRKDRFVLQIGALTALLTLISNKTYLGWRHHTWDPITLGIFLIGTAIYLRRWLAQGPGGVRKGFTLARLSQREKRLIHAGSALAGFASPPSPTPGPHPGSDEFRFGGGASGGGGAGGDF